MSKNTFVAGVNPGGLNDYQEIKILICFIFEKLNIPLKKDDVTSILQKEGLANYFEVSQAFSQMVNNNNIVINEDEKYTITESGKVIVSELGDSLPMSVREKAIVGANAYLKRIKNEKENKVIIKKSDNGYTVTCKVSGGDFNMLELKLYAPDIMAAMVIKNNFYKDPEALYSNIISFLTNDFEVTEN